MSIRLQIVTSLLTCLLVMTGLSIIVVFANAESIDQKFSTNSQIQLLTDSTIITSITSTPFQPIKPTVTQSLEIVQDKLPTEAEVVIPTVQPTEVVQPTSTEVVQPIAIQEVLSFEEMLKMGWTTITVFVPWGENLVFSFYPAFVDFSTSDLPAICPYDGYSGCVGSFGNGVYAVVHSEYPGAVAEGARQSIEGLLYPLSVIKEHVASLQGANVQITTTDGRIIKAKVAEATRTTDVKSIYKTAENRYANPDSLVLEFCGLPHIEDQTKDAGVTGSVYKITIVQ